MKVTVLRNDAQVPPGRLDRVARDRGIGLELVALDAGDELPAVDTVESVVVLGGEMGAYDEDRYPHIAAEKRFLAEAVDAGIPVLGLCLGCQLLADALGGRAYLADRPELYFGPLERIASDGVVDHLTPGPTLSIHWDTWDLPPGGELLAQSARYPQAFRLGSAIGIQPHPEVDLVIVASWLESDGGAALATEAGVDPGEVLGALASGERHVAALADRFFGAWIDEAERTKASRE